MLKYLLSKNSEDMNRLVIKDAKNLYYLTYGMKLPNEFANLILDGYVNNIEKVEYFSKNPKKNNHNSSINSSLYHFKVMDK